MGLSREETGRNQQKVICFLFIERMKEFGNECRHSHHGRLVKSEQRQWVGGAILAGTIPVGIHSPIVKRHKVEKFLIK